MRIQITNKLKAGYPCLYLLSQEEQRVEAELRAIAKTLDYTFLNWSVTTGLVKFSGKNPEILGDTVDLFQALDAFLAHSLNADGEIEGTHVPNKSIVLLKDFHLFLADPNPVLFRKLKDAFTLGKNSNRHLIILGCSLRLPPELEKEISVLEFKLPDRAQLQVVLESIATSANQKLNGSVEALLDAASGLTTIEAENAFALSIIEKQELDAKVVAREKAATLKKNGLLEIVESKVELKDIGGMGEMKEWMVRRKAAFTADARKYGLPVPKGLLAVGIPGCGKSLFSKAVANILGNLPLLKLDAGTLFGSLVGKSEENMRAVIQTAEAIAPCVLWVDEIEKGFSGSKSSGSTDGGTSARVFGTFLQWMQEKKAPVFVVATANDISQLPPEFLRKGRFDELFFIDLPDLGEREDIWRIQIARFNRRPKDFDLPALAKITEGWTGSEIEALFTEALFAAYDGNREPDTALCESIAREIVPLSKTMSQQIEGLRTWATGRARRATAQAANMNLIKPGRKLG